MSAYLDTKMLQNVQRFKSTCLTSNGMQTDGRMAFQSYNIDAGGKLFLVGLYYKLINDEDMVNDYFSSVLNDSHVELNGQFIRSTLDAAGVAEVVANTDCPHCSCVIEMCKICVGVFMCSSICYPPKWQSFFGQDGNQEIKLEWPKNLQ